MNLDAENNEKKKTSNKFLSMKGISVVLYGSQIDTKAKENKDKGGELITEFFLKMAEAQRN